MYLSAEGWLTSGMVTSLWDSDGISLSLSSTKLVYETIVMFVK